MIWTYYLHKYFWFLGKRTEIKNLFLWIINTWLIFANILTTNEYFPVCSLNPSLKQIHSKRIKKKTYKYGTKSIKLISHTLIRPETWSVGIAMQLELSIILRGMYETRRWDLRDMSCRFLSRNFMLEITALTLNIANSVARLHNKLSVFQFIWTITFILIGSKIFDLRSNFNYYIETKQNFNYIIFCIFHTTT